MSDEDLMTKPAWAGEYGVGYDDIVASWPGVEVVQSDYLGSYQGDACFLLRQGSAWGLLIVGYGSCSGCDHLQAITPWSDEDGDWTQVIDFRDELQGDVHWESSKEALGAWVLANPENHWWCYDREVKNWLRQHLDVEFPDAADADPDW